MTDRIYNVLLVEDNPGDVLLIEEALSTAGLKYKLTHCETVMTALEKVSDYGPDDGEVPDLLLLDYNLPGGDAREVLKACLANPALSQTRKAVISSSLSPRDREDALKSGAQCFIYKPADLDSFLNEVGTTVVAMLSDPPAQEGTSSQLTADGQLSGT